MSRSKWLGGRLDREPAVEIVEKLNVTWDDLEKRSLSLAEIKDGRLAGNWYNTTSCHQDFNAQVLTVTAKDGRGVIDPHGWMECDSHTSRSSWKVVFSSGATVTTKYETDWMYDKVMFREVFSFNFWFDRRQAMAIFKNPSAVNNIRMVVMLDELVDGSQPSPYIAIDCDTLVNNFFVPFRSRQHLLLFNHVAPLFAPPGVFFSQMSTYMDTSFTLISRCLYAADMKVEIEAKNASETVGVVLLPVDDSEDEEAVTFTVKEGKSRFYCGDIKSFYVELRPGLGVSYVTPKVKLFCCNVYSGGGKKYGFRAASDIKWVVLTVQNDLLCLYSGQMEW